MDCSYNCTDVRFRRAYQIGNLGFVIADLKFENEHEHSMGWFKNCLLVVRRGFPRLPGRLVLTDGELGLDLDEQEALTDADTELLKLLGKHYPNFDIYNEDFPFERLRELCAISSPGTSP